MNGRVSPRLVEPINKSEKRNAVPKMMENGDVRGDGSFKVAVTSFVKIRVATELAMVLCH